MKNQFSVILSFLTALFFLSLSSCKNSSAGPDAEPTPMPAVYAFENAEGDNNWVVVTDAYANKLSAVEIVSPGSSGSGHAIAITLTVTTTGSGAPYTDNAFSFWPAPTSHSINCTDSSFVAYGGPNLNGYTVLKFDAKVMVVTPPVSGTLSYGVNIQASRSSCDEVIDKKAGNVFFPGAAWAEVSLLLNTFPPAGAYTLAQVYGDVLWVEFRMDIASSAVNDKAVVVLYLDNMRFE